MNTNELLAELAAELDTLLKSGDVDANQPHPSALHESDAAKRDRGGMRYCPSCRAIILVRRAKEVLESLHDDKPQQQFGGKSRRDEVLERLLDCRQVELGP